MSNAIDTLENKYGIRVPSTPRFDVRARFKLGRDDALEGIILLYIDKETGTKLHFTTQIERKDGKYYCTFDADRRIDLSQEETVMAIIRELHEHELAWQCNFYAHVEPVYIGKGSVVVPIDNNGDEIEFISFVHRALPQLAVGLKKVDRDHECIAERFKVSEETSILLATDSAVDKYQELLSFEFED